MGNRDRRERGDDYGARKTGHRHTRLQHLITEIVDAVVRDELTDPAVQEVVLTGTALSPDGHHLHVWFVAPEVAAAQVALDRSSAFVRARLLDRLGLDRVPHLHFAPDPRGDALIGEDQVGPADGKASPPR